MQIQMARIFVPWQWPASGCGDQIEAKNVVIKMRGFVEVRNDGAHVTSPRDCAERQVSGPEWLIERIGKPQLELTCICRSLVLARIM